MPIGILGHNKTIPAERGGMSDGSATCKSVHGEMETANTDELFHKLVKKAKEKMTYQSGFCCLWVRENMHFNNLK